MVGHTADVEQDAAFVVDDARDLLLELIPEGRPDERLSLLGAEDDVIEKIG
jgi:hypothetical protein